MLAVRLHAVGLDGPHLGVESISTHCGRRASPDRAAVSTRDSNASLAAVVAPAARTVGTGLRDFRMRPRTQVSEHASLAPERCADPFGRVVGPLLHGDGPRHHGVDEAADPSHRLRLLVRDLGGTPSTSAFVTSETEPWPLQAGRPVLCVLRTAPAGPLLPHDDGGRERSITRQLRCPVASALAGRDVRPAADASSPCGRLKRPDGTAWICRSQRPCSMGRRGRRRSPSETLSCRLAPRGTIRYHPTPDDKGR